MRLLGKALTFDDVLLVPEGIEGRVPYKGSVVSGVMTKGSRSTPDS